MVTEQMQEASFAQLHLFPMYCLVWNENYLLTWLHQVLKVNNTKYLTRLDNTSRERNIHVNYVYSRELKR